MTLSARLRVERGGFVLDVDLRAPGGEVVAVLGPNGAGKSTLLRALAGLVPLSAGRVVLSGTVLDDVAARLHRPPATRGVGVVFQDYRLFPHLSARDNVAFGLRAAGVPRADARAQAAEWLDRLDLAGLADRRPRELSGGQAQRVAVARALAPSPGLLLLDEPLAALDAGTRAQVRGELRRTLAGFTGPCLLVTHDPMDALTLADRLLVLEAGRVVQDGPPAEVARRPATRYVSQLVGLNLFRGRASGGVLTTEGGARVVVPGGVEGDALATVRPSAVTLHPGEPPASSARNRWPGRVATVEALGDRARVAVAGTGDGPDVLADVTAQTVAELRLAPGDAVWATVKATDVDVYPAAPGP